MELEEARDILANCIDDYVIAEYCSSCDDKESCKDNDCIFSKAIEVVSNHLTKQEKMIELIEKECRQRLAFAKRIRRSEKRNPDDFNQGLEFESATIMNLLSGEPHWEYEGKYFDDIDKQVEKLKAEESE